MLQVRNLNKVYVSGAGTVRAVDDISFVVAEGEFFTLLGPSGCGKSTTLRCVAGLENFDEGEILMDGKTVASPSVFVPPNDRPIGMVFQSYAIWPHMSVLGNVTFPLYYRGGEKGGGMSAKKRRERGLEALKLVHLDHLADRPAPYLSGGQQQRVALARSLVSHPKVLLLDEPLSNLDAKLREDMRFEIKELVTRLGITTMYVTHDQTEALSMSDRIAVLAEGRVRQIGTPKEVYLASSSAGVARVVGSVNVVTGKLGPSANGFAQLTTDKGTPIRCRLANDGVGEKAELMVRPELISVLPESAPADRMNGANVLTGKVIRVLFAGDHIDCYCETPDGMIRAKLPPDNELGVNDSVRLYFKPEHCVAS